MSEQKLPMAGDGSLPPAAGDADGAGQAERPTPHRPRITRSGALVETRQHEFAVTKRFRGGQTTVGGTQLTDALQKRDEGFGDYRTRDES